MTHSVRLHPVKCSRLSTVGGHLKVADWRYLLSDLRLPHSTPHSVAAPTLPTAAPTLPTAAHHEVGRSHDPVDVPGVFFSWTQ